MTTDDSTGRPEPPTEPASLPPETSITPTPVPAAEPPAARPDRGPGLGHIVLGALLILIGAGWLLEALDVADVPWRFLLPAALIIVGAALAVGARTGSHGGLLAVGVVLTVLVLLAGAVDILADIPLSGGIGEKNHRPAGGVEDEYRWGIGKMTLDLRSADPLTGQEIEASVGIGELVVLVPGDVPLAITGHSGIGEVIVLGERNDGFDAELTCVGTAREVACSSGDDLDPGEPALLLVLKVGMGKVEVQR